VEYTADGAGGEALGLELLDESLHGCGPNSGDRLVAQDGQEVQAQGIVDDALGARTRDLDCFPGLGVGGDSDPACPGVNVIAAYDGGRYLVEPALGVRLLVKVPGVLLAGC